MMIRTVNQIHLKRSQAVILDTIRSLGPKSLSDAALTVATSGRNGQMHGGGHPCQELLSITNPSDNICQLKRIMLLYGRCASTANQRQEALCADAKGN